MVDGSAPIARAPNRQEVEDLLVRMAETARPGEGATRALSHVIRVLRRCPWLDGELRMVLAADGPSTDIHLFADHRCGSERVLRTVSIDVPLDEIEEVVHHAPGFFAPLMMRRGPGGLVFTAHGSDGAIATDTFPPERPTRKRALLSEDEAGGFEAGDGSER